MTTDICIYLGIQQILVWRDQLDTVISSYRKCLIQCEYKRNGIWISAIDNGELNEVLHLCKVVLYNTFSNIQFTAAFLKHAVQLAEVEKSLLPFTVKWQPFIVCTVIARFCHDIVRYFVSIVTKSKIQSLYLFIRKQIRYI